MNELDVDLISVTYPGMIVGRPHTIPMKVTVNAPTDINDFALSYIMQVLKDDILQIEDSLQRLSQEDMDFNNGDADLNIETYNFGDIVGDTFRPTSSPTITPKETNSAIVVEDNTGGGVPWWTWLLVALAVIICILISRCYMNRSKDEMDEEKEQQLTMYVNNQMHDKSRSGQASVAASHRTYRTQHRSNGARDDNMFLGQPIAASRSSQQQSSRQRRQPRKSRGSDQSSRATKRSQRPRSRRPEEMSTATDPPEEGSRALVVHTRRYDDEIQTGADPDGDKISPKKSMYASGALMEEVHRERQEKSARRKPKRRGTIEKLKSSLRWNQKYTDGELEDEIVPYIPEPEEEYDEQYTSSNNNSRNNNSRKPPRKKSSFGDKLRASFNWRQSQQPFDDPVNDPIFSTSLQTNDLEDCPQIDLEVGSTDSPSILTNRNPGDGDLDPQAPVRNSDEYEEDREYDREKKKMKKEKRSKSRRSDRESSKKRSNGSDRRSSRKKQGLLASFTRRKSITWNDGGGSGDEESYSREYEREDGYSSRGS